jgi:hypothetical protein
VFSLTNKSLWFLVLFDLSTWRVVILFVNCFTCGNRHLNQNKFQKQRIIFRCTIIDFCSNPSKLNSFSLEFDSLFSSEINKMLCIFFPFSLSQYETHVSSLVLFTPNQLQKSQKVNLSVGWNMISYLSSFSCTLFHFTLHWKLCMCIHICVIQFFG